MQRVGSHCLLLEVEIDGGGAMQKLQFPNQVMEILLIKFGAAQRQRGAAHERQNPSSQHAEQYTRSLPGKPTSVAL